MKKAWAAAMAIAIFFSIGAIVCAQEAAEVSGKEPAKFGGVAAETASESYTVEAIDAVQRLVTLKNAVGGIKVVPCGPEVRNFDQIRVGDAVTVSVFQYAEVTVMPDANAPLARKEELEVAGAQLGEKPKGTITATLKVMAVVEDVDYASRQVVIQGPERRVKMTAGPDAKNFDRVKKGDNVYLELTERMQITVADA